VVAEEAHERRAQAARGGRAGVIAIVERDQVGRVVREEPQPAVQLGQLVEIHEQHPHRVLEAVRDGARADVQEARLVHGRAQAARLPLALSRSSAAAASMPARRPSSWKPWPK
jgi:hypothetical protein